MRQSRAGLTRAEGALQDRCVALTLRGHPFLRATLDRSTGALVGVRVDPTGPPTPETIAGSSPISRWITCTRRQHADLVSEGQVLQLKGSV